MCRLLFSFSFIHFIYLFIFFPLSFSLFHLSVYPFSTGEVGNFRGFLNDQTGACVYLYYYYECVCAYACAFACQSRLRPLVFRDGTKLQSDYETSIEYFIYDYDTIYEVPNLVL